MFLGAVPAAGEFYAADLLGSAPFSSQLSELDTFYDEVSSPIRKIDIYQILSTAKDDYIYHRTDAQWTGYGAYCVYRSAIRKMGFIPVSYDQYAVSHVERTGAVCTVRATTDGSHRTSSTGTRAAPAAASHL